MCRGIGSIYGHIGDVVAGERLDAFGDIRSALGVAMETGVAPRTFKSVEAKTYAYRKPSGRRESATYTTLITPKNMSLLFFYITKADSPE